MDISQPESTHVMRAPVPGSLDESEEIPSQFDGGVPILEGEGRGPHLPEVGREEVLAEHLVDALVGACWRARS
nr:hypothetical protein [Frondihabitans sp. PAMC 28766]